MSFRLLSNRNEFGYPLRFNAASAAELILPTTIATSYDNPLGSGDRTASINIMTDSLWWNSATKLEVIDGNTVSGGLQKYPNYFPNSGTVSFNLGSHRRISRIKLYLDMNLPDADDWQIRGYTSEFQSDILIQDARCVNGENEFIINDVSPTPYYKFDIRAYSNLPSSPPPQNWGYIREVEFKIDDGT